MREIQQRLAIVLSGLYSILGIMMYYGQGGQYVLVTIFGTENLGLFILAFGLVSLLVSFLYEKLDVPWIIMLAGIWFTAIIAGL